VQRLLTCHAMNSGLSKSSMVVPGITQGAQK